ncbi:MAG: hypothetical protein ACRD82_13945, partial [Blastocatellia bacterium]
MRLRAAGRLKPLLPPEGGTTNMMAMDNLMMKKLLAVTVAAMFLTTGLVSAEQQTDMAMLSDGQLHVVMCGTGSPLADATRASACVAVIAGGEVVLIDVGPG